MKDNNVEELRGPNVRDNYKPHAARRSNVTYAEMIPATGPREVQSPPSKLFIKH